MVDEPTEEDRLKFVRSYGVEPVDVNTDLTFKDAATAVAEMTPIIGDAMAAKEVYDELMKDEPNYGLIAALGGAALVGAVPGIGDAAAAGIRKAVDVAKRVEVDPDALGSLGGNIRLKPKEQVDFDAKMAALDEAEDATTWQQNAKKVVKERGIDLDDKKSPEAIELQESTRLLLENKITRDQHLETVDKVKPVSEYDQLPREPSDKALVFALDSGKREKGVFVLDDETASKLGAKTSSLKVGDQFNSRLDIPAYLSHDTWIVAGTSPAVKTADGKGVTSYAKAVHFGGDDKPVRFIASQKQSEKIGTGVDNKTGYATVSGTVKDLDADAIRAKAAELLNDPEWTQVGFDPRRQGGFYVRAGKNKHVPVREATEVIQIGPLVLAKNAKLDLEYQGYSEGGMALEEQMEMNFGREVPDNTIGIDPVSGNEIPLGSTAENVRDDIPANLSEGEIVIPADVVNFHGVKLFEDLRAEAKMGYAQMAADGRMGGEPMMEEDMDIELNIEDLDVMDDEEPVEMYRGGTSMAQYKGVTKNRNIKSSKPMTAAQHQAKIRGGSYSKRRRGSKPAPAAQTAAAQQASAQAAATNTGMSSADYLKSKVGQGGDSFTGPGVEVAGLNNIPEGMSIAQYTGFAPNFNTMSNIEKRVRKDDEPFFTTNPDGTNRYEQYIAPNLGKLNPFSYFDEGGLVNPEPFYSQKGGFDLSSTNTVVVEYMNDEGHRIFITFVDGVPQMEIPEGYYPAGDAVSLDDVVNYTIPTMDGISPEPVQQRTRVSDRDKPETPAPTPVNYKELSIDELKDMIADQRTMGSKIFAGLSPITKLIMWDKTRRTKAEIERRIADPNTSEVDLMRLKNLKELLDREEPGLIKTLLDKVQGKEFERIVSQVKPPVKLDYDFDDPTEAPDQGIAKPYTPDPQESNQMQMTGFEGMGPAPDEFMTTPGVDAPVTPGVPLTRAQIEAAKKASEEAAAIVFGKPEETQPAPQTEVQQMRTAQKANTETKTQKARDKSKAISLAAKSTGKSIAEVGRTLSPSNERQNIDYGDPRRGGAPNIRRGGGGRNKGGLATKKSKKKKSK